MQSALKIGFAIVLLPAWAVAQQQPLPQPRPQQAMVPMSPVDTVRPSYVLGSGDRIVIQTEQVEEINNKAFTVDTDGFINLPRVGRIPAKGLKVEELEAALVVKLRTIVREPLVNITVVQYRNEPVFFVGAFKTPGIYPLLGERTLIEMLTSVGGVQPNASRRIRVTRRAEFGKIQLPNAVEDAAGKTSSVEIGLGSLRENVNPAEDIILRPFDVISVERAEMIYVNGEVGRVGPLELGERDSISILQVLSLAGGVTKTANPKKAWILRPQPNTAKRKEIPIDLDKVVKGKVEDFALLPNDVLYVPRSSKAKEAVTTTATYLALPLASSLIYLLVIR